MTGHGTQVCVVGAGPRGICVVQRLCANAAERRPGRVPVVVHVVDPMLFSGGATWSTDQPAELLMNTVASQVTLFTDDSVDCEGPILPGPSLHEWARFVDHFDPYEEYPEHVRAEAARLGPDDYPTRALYGHYLNWALRRLIARPGARVTVVPHRETAVALDDAPDGSQTVTLSDGTLLSGLAAVVLAQGHLPMLPDSQEYGLAWYARENGLTYVPAGNPSQADLTGVRPGEAVGLRGMGLNFFDYMILLTEGRGGRFTRAAPGSDGLVYHRSGREPVLHAGSRRGVPYHARGENQKGPWGRHEPRFLTPDLIGTLRERARCGGTSLEFRRDVWPLITLEVLAVYHAALVAERGSPGDRDRFLRQYLPAVAKDEAAGETVLDDFGIPPGDRWDWERLARPYGGRSFADHAEYRAWLLDHLKADVAEARRGNVDSPLKAAVDVLRDLRNEIRLAVDHSGLTGRSYRDELQGWYTPLNAFLSIGPPARRVAEAVALVEAGVLRVMGPGLRVGTEPGGAGFRLSSDTVPGGAVRAGTLIEARMPEVDIRHTTDPLIGHLMAAGQCLPYRIPDGPGRFHRIGGLTVTGPPYRLVDARGRVHPRRFAFGVPTEGVHWATAAGVRPGVNSVILGDADAIARASLRAAHTPDAAPVPCRNRITWTRRT